ncbi:MAG: hypothetical protein ACOC3V_00340 [bacterium]
MEQLKKYIYDVDYRARTEINGGLKYIWNDEALNQSVKLWLASFKGEIVRDPSRSGYITYWLMRPMNEAVIDNIETAIYDGFYQDFRPYLEIRTLKIEPNYAERYWYIYMEVYSTYLNLETTVEERIKARV